MGLTGTTNFYHNFSKWSTTIGCFLLLLPFGQTFFWGNMYIYCKSYLVHYRQASPTPNGPWVLSLKICTTGLTSLFAGFVMKYLGRRPLLICGIVLTSASHFLTYQAIQESNWMMILSFGVLYGLADGFIFCLAIQYTVEWAGVNDGLYVAFVRSAQFVGAIFTNFFVTWYVNPENEVPDRRVGPIVFFSQEDVLERVPFTFIILGCIYSVSQIVGLFMLRDRPEAQLEKSFKSVESYGSIEDGVKSEKSSTKDLESGVGLVEQRLGLSSTSTTPSSVSPPLSSSTSNETEADKSLSAYLASSLLPPSPPPLLPPQQSPLPSSTLSSSSSSFSSSSSSSSSSPSTSPSSLQDPIDIPPSEAIRTSRFYNLLFTFTTMAITYVTINSYYKQYGQLWIHNDFYLTKVGLLIPIASILASLLWGFLMDKFGLKTCFVVLNACLIMFGSVYYITPQVSTCFFSICTILLGGMVCPLYSIYNSATVKMFGKASFSRNQGLVLLPSIVVNIILPSILEAILVNLGWAYLFLFPALMNFIALISILLTDFKTS